MREIRPFLKMWLMGPFCILALNSSAQVSQLKFTAASLCSLSLEDRSPLENELLFSLPERPSQSFFSGFAHTALSKPIAEQSTKAERLAAIAQFPVAEIVANPGHRVLRDRELVEAIAQSIRDGSYRLDLSERGPAINIVTDPSGRVLSVDLWEGHHRFLAQLLAGRERVSDVPAEELKIYVNGSRPTDADFPSRPHLIPSFGADFIAANFWFPLRPPERNERGKNYKIRPDPLNEGKKKDLIVDGRNSNYQLGSRENLRTVLENMTRKQQPRVGVYFLAKGEPLPTYSEIKKLAEHKLRSNVVFVWAENSDEPRAEDIERLQTWNRAHVPGRPFDSPHFNIYRGVSVATFISQHGRSSFEKRIQQIFASTNSVEVISSHDSE